MRDQTRLLRIVFVITLGFFLTLAVVSYSRIEALLGSEQLVNRSTRTTLELERVMSSLKDAETGQRGYLLTHDSMFLGPYNTALREYPGHLEILKQLLHDDPRQQSNLHQVEWLGARQETYLQDMITHGGVQTPGSQQMAVGKSIMDSLRNQVNVMTNVEQELLQERQTILHKDRLLAPATILALSILAFLILMAAYWQLNGYLKKEALLKNELVKQAIALERDKELRNILAQTPAGISVLEGPRHTYILANKFYQKLSNRTEQQLLGKTIREVFPELEAQGIPAIFDKVWQTGEPYVADAFFAQWDREQNGIMVPGWFSFIVQPLKDEDGKVTSIMMHTLDITEQMESRKKIEESEHRFAFMVYSSPLIVAILKGPDLILEIGNDSLLDHLGKGRGILGKPYLVANPELEEQGIGAILRDVYRTGMPFQIFETPVYLIRNGVKESRYYNYLVQPQRQIDGTIDGIAIMATEVTRNVELNNKVRESEALYRELSQSLEQKVQERTNELKQSEEKFNTLFQLSPQGMVLSDREGKYVIINENFTRIFGYTQEEVVGKTSMELQLTSTELRERIIEAMKQKGSITNMEAEMRKKTGENVPVLFSVVVVHIGDQQYFLSAANDIAEQRRALEEIEKNNRELKKMNEELESFNYISSHDLQEPLRKIQMFSAMLLENELNNFSEQEKDLFNKIQKTAERMQQLINDLLLYSRTNNAQRVFENTDLTIIMNQVVDELSEDISAKNATVEFGKMVSARIVPFQFRQLMHNLIGNALKFSDPGRPPHITISSAIQYGAALHHPKLSAQTKYCHIAVSDNGIGFEPEYKERIFGVFQRLHARNQYEGTGIGLSIAKSIVENHNGVITASAQPGVGATFDIYIPVV